MIDIVSFSLVLFSRYDNEKFDSLFELDLKERRENQYESWKKKKLFITQEWNYIHISK